jgi:predicted ATPase
VETLELAGDQPADSRPDIGSAPIVGRDADLALLRDVYQRSRDTGMPHLVRIVGDYGTGKSRLAAELFRWVRAQGDHARILEGHCPPHRAAAEAPLLEMLLQRAGVHHCDGVDRARQRVTAAVAADVGVFHAAAAAVADVLAGVAVSPRTETVDTAARATDAWVAWLAGMTRRRPTLLCIEDAQHAHSAFLVLLEEALGRVGGPLLVLLLGRDGGAASTAPRGENELTLRLGPLSAPDAARLLGALLPVEPAEPTPSRGAAQGGGDASADGPATRPWRASDSPPAVFRRLLERADGNPRFLEEIVANLLASEVLVRTGDGWTVKVAKLDLPDSIEAAVQSRLDCLEREQRRALRLAAVAGRTFWRGLLATQATDPAVVDALVDALRHGGLVDARAASTIPGERELAFRQAIVRDVAYAGLPTREKAMAHAAVAGWLDGLGERRRRDLAEVVAHHHLEAYRHGRRDPGSDPAWLEGQRRDAMRWFLEASGDARARRLDDRAAQLDAEALELSDNDQERAMVRPSPGLVAHSEAEPARNA